MIGSRIIYKHKQNPAHRYDEIYQYHCNAGCVANIGKKSVLQFVEKRWSEREVLQVIDVLRKTEGYLASV